MSSPQPPVCPQCGYQNPEDATVCSICGHRFREDDGRGAVSTPPEPQFLPAGQGGGGRKRPSPRLNAIVAGAVAVVGIVLVLVFTLGGGGHGGISQGDLPGTYLERGDSTVTLVLSPDGTLSGGVEGTWTLSGTQITEQITPSGEGPPVTVRGSVRSEGGRIVLEFTTGGTRTIFEKQ